MNDSIFDSGRRPANLRAGYWIHSLMLALVCLGAAPHPAWSADKEDKGPQISRSIAKEMQAAYKAVQTKQWAEAIKNLDAALAKSGLTPVDEKAIYYTRGIADYNLKDTKSAQADFEKALATGAATAEEKGTIGRTLFSIAASSGQYQKTIDFGKEMVDAGTATPEVFLAITQSYYLLKDCKDAILWSDKSVAAARKAGEAPKENLFLFKLQCYSDASDNKSMVPVLEDLIRLNPNKSTYWNNLLRIENQDERDDRATLMIYRLMFDTGAMDAGNYYTEMASFLGEAALPEEAQTVLEKAFAANLIKDDQKDHATRLLNSVKTRAEADKKGLASLDAEATKNPAGELDVKLGEVYYGLADYTNAVTAINRGLGKGQVKHLDEAYVYLARSEVALKNTAEAKKAIANLKTVPNISPRVVTVWELYGETLH
jgi:tetratricopeptide (TPR) repeat protein